MFTFSHNHCGPRLGDDLVDYYPVEAEQVELVDEYTTLMVTRCVAMVGEALAKLAPASLQIGEGTDDLRRQPPQQPRGRRPDAAGQGRRRSTGRSITPCRC